MQLSDSTNRETIDALKYAQMYLDKGKAYADKHFSHYINHLFFVPPKLGLFEQVSDFSYEADDVIRKKNLIKVLERYEAYHATGKTFQTKLPGGVAEMKRQARSSHTSKNHKRKQFK
jgi:hypothetical protein